MHYTIRNIPDDLDRALRARAAAEQRSLEDIIVDLLVRSLGAELSSSASERLDSERANNWKEDPEFKVALRDQNMIDWDAWSDGIQRRDFTEIAGKHLITPEMREVFAEQRRVDPELWK
jgi:plasmid stability protein